MNQSPFNVVSKNGLSLPNEIEEKIAELSVYQRKEWKPILDNLKVETAMEESIFMRVVPKTKVQDVLDYFYWNTSNQELLRYLAAFYVEHGDYMNTLNRCVEFLRNDAIGLGGRIHVDAHRSLVLMDYQTLITFRNFVKLNPY